jgi:hypothetical protein
VQRLRVAVMRPQRALPASMNATCTEDTALPDDISDELEECPYCGGDGGDPFSDYALACPLCEGEG